MSNDFYTTPGNPLEEENPTPTQTPITYGESKILNEVYYNCTECNSLIEILSINEKDNTIEFKCSNNKDNYHQKSMSIKEFLNKMTNNTNNNVNKDLCEVHKNKYMSFCFNCNKHLCKECLKTREHIYHNKNNVIEIQPINSELKAIKDIIHYYDDKLENMKSKKIIIKQKLNDTIEKYKINIQNCLKTKLEKNEESKNNELKNNETKFLSEIKKLKNKYEKDIKSLKQTFLQTEGKINNKYKLKKEKIEIFCNGKIKILENIYDRIMKKISIEQKIEDLTNLKRINKLVYNTYNLYNNNYFNAKNINNIIINFHKSNDIIKNNIQKTASENDYEIILKLSMEELKNQISQTALNKDDKKDDNQSYYNLELNLLEYEKQKLFLERKLNEKNNELEKLKEKYEKEIKDLKNQNETKEILINNSLNNSSSNSNIIKEYSNGRYIGGILNDKREGKGSFYYKNGKKYEGEWKNDTEEGFGIMKYKNGDQYEGYFKKGKKEGKGIYYYNNGNRYEGDWLGDKKDGKGIFYGSNGDRKVGDYSKGKPFGKHVILFANGEVEQRESNN